VGLYVTRRCHHSNKIIELLEPAGEYFGDPRTNSTKCSKEFLRSNVREWHYRDDKHLLWFSIVIGNPILYALLPAVVFIAIALYFEFEEENLKLVIPIYIISFILLCLKSQIFLSGIIRDSNEILMNDPQYKKEMDRIFKH